MKSKNTIIIILLLALVAGWFYWWQYRPSMIRKECSVKTSNWWKKMPPDAASIVTDALITGKTDLYRRYYENCLSANGL